MPVLFIADTAIIWCFTDISSRFFLALDRACATLFFDNLSALLSNRIIGRFWLSHQSIKFMSSSLKGWRISIMMQRALRHCLVDRYMSISLPQRDLISFDTFAYPYPGKSIILKFSAEPISKTLMA